MKILTTFYMSIEYSHRTVLDLFAENFFFYLNSYGI